MLRKLGIEQGEGRIFAWAVGTLFLLGWADVSVKNVSETLFLKRVGVQLLPLVFLINSLLLVVTTYVVGRMAARGDRLRLLPGVLLVLALILLPLWFLVLQDVASVFALLVIASKETQSIALLVFWVALADLLNARQAKRLFAPLMAGLTLGNILGSFASDPISRVIGIAGLLPFSAGALALSALLTLPLRGVRRRGLQRISERRRHVLTVDTETGSVATGRTLWRDSRLFRLLFISAACSGVVGPMLYFQFSYVADLATQGEERLMAFYAQFRGWINIGILGIQLVLASRLYRRIGVPLATAISPVIYLLGFVGLSVRLSLPAGVGAMAGTKLQDNAVYDPAIRVLFNLLPGATRSRAMALLEGPVKRAGGAIGNVVILVAMWVGSATVVGFAALPVTAVWLVMALALWRSYPALLLQASASRSRLGADFDVAEMLDANTLRSLSRYLLDPSPSRCRVAVDLVSEGEPQLAAGILAEAAHAAPDATRPILVAALDRVLERSVTSAYRNEAAAGHLAALLGESTGLSERDRADVVQAYGRLTLDATREAEVRVLARALRDPSPAVRLAAGAALYRCGASGSVPFDLDVALRDAAASGDPVLRRVAREEYRTLLLRGEPSEPWQLSLARLAELLAVDADRAEVAEALADVAERHREAVAGVRDRVLGWRDDPDPRVRGAMLRFIGHAGLEEHSGWLVSQLGAERGPDAAQIRASARAGLRALGARAADALLVELSFGRRSVREEIMPLVRELDVGTKTLRELYERELDSIRHKLVALHAAVRAGFAPLLLQRLGERLDEGLHTALHLLAALHDDDRIAGLAGPLGRARGRREHAILLEALEALLPPTEKQQLIPLLEDRTVAERGVMAARALGVAIPSYEETLQGLLEDPDELTRCLAVATLPAAGAAAPRDGLAPARDLQDDDGMLTPVERAMLLRGIPLFERLTTRQLMNVAEVVVEEEYPPGSVICRAGEASNCMYLIVDGVVAITTPNDTVLNELRSNDFFGEIAVFEGATRSANVVTGSSQVSVLRLDREDILNLMEEMPGIAICICQTLSRRVRDLTRRVTV